MDAMYSTWHSDPVSGERITYSKIGLGLGPLDFIGKNEPAMKLMDSPTPPLASPSRGAMNARAGRMYLPDTPDGHPSWSKYL